MPTVRLMLTAVLLPIVLVALLLLVLGCKGEPPKNNIRSTEVLMPRVHTNNPPAPTISR